MHNVLQSDQLWTPTLVISDRTAARMIRYWYHTVACPSVCLRWRVLWANE